MLGESLVNAGFITQEMADECLAIQASTDRRLGDIIIEKGYITQKELMRVLENQHNVSYIDLSRAETNYTLAKIIPVELARANVLAPVKIVDGKLYVAIEDPKDFRAIDAARATARMEVQPLLAGGRSILDFIDRLYGTEHAQRALSDFRKEINLEEVAATVGENESDIITAPVVRLVNALVEQAVNAGASDIHIEPFASNVRIRMRVDGILSTALEVPLAAINAIIARIKILANLNIAEHRAPQDGRFNMTVGGRTVDVRVSIVPTAFGEKVVMRLLDRSSFLVPKERLGLSKENITKFDSMLMSPNGIILITGPTGSGKSTTLYTMLAEMNSVRDNITTIEDPIEYMLEGINQIQVNPRAGISFSSGLRALLRQDPDVIMVGEIRDPDTVEIAIRAAITGHLVLSTIHTNDTVSTIYRLMDMGIPAYMIAAALSGLVAQRLVRKICPFCKQKYIPSTVQLDLASIDPETAAGSEFYIGAGCSQCNETGYKGRIAIYEILEIDQTLRDMIHASASLGDIRKHAVNSGMITLRDSALALLNSGTTSLEEVIAITHVL